MSSFEIRNRIIDLEYVLNNLLDTDDPRVPIIESEVRQLEKMIEPK